MLYCCVIDSHERHSNVQSLFPFCSIGRGGGRGRGGPSPARSGSIQQYQGTKVRFDD